MANSLYDKGRQKFLDGSIAWSSDTIKVVLVDITNYTVNLGSDEYMSDIPLIARTSIGGPFSGKTSTAGVADANDVTFSAVTGDESAAVVIYKDSGVDSSSPLIAYIDTATGLPITPNGGDITVAWSNASNKIFKL